VFDNGSGEAKMNYWKYQQSRLQKQIENWKNRGYDISMKDFEFKEPPQ